MADRRAVRDTKPSTYTAGYPRPVQPPMEWEEPSTRERVADALRVGLSALLILGGGYLLVSLALGAL